ncbi:MAG: hypothetical protein HQ521_03075 [Bacteroidetes bacterium]|nr:hypothetical protein [Bacteroidota bacterium]
MMEGINYTERTPGIMTIEVLQSSKISSLILQILISISFLIPIGATIFLVITFELKPAILITYVIFWATGYYFLKLYLWNKYGKEIIYLEKENVICVADYKLFKGNRREISANNIKIKIQNSKGEIENLGTLVISDGNINIDSVIEVPINELVELKYRIEKYYA